MVVHGDGLTALGPVEELKKLESTMNGWCDVRTRGKLGPEKSNCREIKILNRKVGWAAKKVIYEADQKNTKTILRELGRGGQAKGLGVPMAVSKEASPDQVPGLTGDEAGRLRRIALR